MKYDSQRIAMAELEGWRKIYSPAKLEYRWVAPDGHNYLECSQTYDTIDDCQRVFKGLSDDQKIKITMSLEDQGNGYLLELTPDQWREAILRAAGKWQEGNQ